VPETSPTVAETTPAVGETTPAVGDYARNYDAPVEEPRRRDLGSAFRRADVAEIPAQRRPASLGDLQPAVKRPENPAERSIPGWGRRTDAQRPTTLGDQPRPGGDPRRPADLRDHLRETRPADLAQYSSKARTPVEAPRRPASLGDLMPARRPATLADHLGESRRTEEGSS